jgi:uncharacterized protein YhaN
VLFGYPHGIIDGFKHGAKDIAIGIDLLAADGRTLSFVRRRRGKHTLTAADGSVLDEGGVENFLGGASRDVFEKVFALNHHRLREHGKALLADGGSLGFSLAEAGSGIAGLKAVLDGLKAERAGLFLAAGTRPRLNQAIAEFVRLRKEARQHTVSPSEYRSHEKRIQETEAALLRTRERRKEIESAIVRLERIRKNLPLRAEHGVLTQRIGALHGVPVLPPAFTQERIKASADLDVAGADLAIASAAIADLEQRIAAIAVDADILLRSEDIESLASRRPVIEKQESERPRWEAERAQLVAAAADLIARAELAGGAADGDRELPPPLKRKVIQDLAEDGKALMVKRATVREHAEAAACALKKARDRAAGMSRPRPVDALSRALTAADRLGADITGDIAKRTSALVRKTKALNDALTGLGVPSDGHSLLAPGAGPLPADPGADRVALLRELVVPSERTEARYAGWLADLEGKIEKGRDDVERLSEELADIDGRIAALKIAGDVATEDDLKAARQARDHGWALVRGLYVDRSAGLHDAAGRFAPDGHIAEAYEARVREADRAVDTLRARVKESTELAFLRRKAADLKTQRIDTTEAVRLLGAQRDTALSEWRALWPAGLITVEAPGEMVDWLARRSAALGTAAELEEERDAVAEVAKRERRARQALAAVMAAFTGEPQDGDVDALRDRARSIIEAAVEANSRHDKAEADLRIMSDRKLETDDAVDRLNARIGEWTEKWCKALVEAGMPPGQTIEAAAATLAIINELEGVKSKIDGLSRRIAVTQADKDAFSDAVAGIAATLPDGRAGAAVAVCRGLEERLRTARRAEMERRGLAGQLESRGIDRERAGDKLRRSSASLEALCAQAGGVSPGELASIERQSAERRDALRDRERIESRVREDGDGRDFAALFAECDEAAGDRIVADLISLKADRADTETHVDNLISQRAALQAEFDSLLGQNQAADLTQDAAVVGAEIGDAVEDYVNLTVQETLLRAAIDVYRDRRQGPILTRARDLFVHLTDGAYAGLRADVEAGETVLVVEDASRGSLGLDALSDGTVDAVYLALRLAVVQEYNTMHEPLPFIADDLLLNLDNKRSEAALRTLAEVAQSSQVLLFTHHAHMMELARRAVPPGILVEHSLSAHAGEAERRRVG